jgi:hypothetical protein
MVRDERYPVFEAERIEDTTALPFDRPVLRLSKG